MKPPIVMIGPFPPPIHGMANINYSVLSQLRASGTTLFVMDVSPARLEQRLPIRLTRLPKIILTLIRLASMRALRGAKLYISVSGGFGQVYEMFFIALARLRGMAVFLHHHSFAYLTRRRKYTQLLLKIAGSSSVHITLSKRMADNLRSLYGASNIVSISNSVFCVRNEVYVSNKPCKKAIRKIGFISNISAQKGIFEFLDLMAAIEAQGLPLQAKIAGPFQDDLIGRTVCRHVSMMTNVDYLGPIFGRDKDDFFKEIDVLVFPTRYENEAEPLIVLEALSHGVPTIAYGRGCIPEIVYSGCGMVVDIEEAFVAVALEKIKLWHSSPELFETASRAAACSYAKIYQKNSQKWRELMSHLIDEQPPKSVCWQHAL